MRPACRRCWQRRASEFGVAPNGQHMAVFSCRRGSNRSHPLREQAQPGLRLYKTVPPAQFRYPPKPNLFLYFAVPVPRHHCRWNEGCSDFCFLSRKDDLRYGLD